MRVDYKLIGTRIKYERIKQKLTQEALAEKIDVSVGYVSQVERGVTKISLDLLAEISSVLECDVAELITESATNSKTYMQNNLESRFSRLNDREKQLLLDIMDSIIKNR